MRISELFTKTRKEAPADEVSKNAQLLIRAGFIHKEMAGVYTFLPLGLRVLENIKKIVREEMNAVDGQELIMTNLQSRDKWELTGRWDDKVVDVWFKTKLKDNSEIGLAWSHEEPIIEMLKQHVTSYKDFPISVYQFQTKLRNELRSKSGIMRGREFVMNDMYSINTNAKDHDNYYNSALEAYKKVYDRLGIGNDTYVTFASGGAFTEFSHEFQTICAAGEDKIYLHKGKNIAINEEVMNEKNLQKLGLKRSELEEVKSSEVGNIFNFGTDKSQKMDFTFTDEKGQKQFPYLGSYGIGITRVMGVIAEKFSDEKGLVWPANIAPALVYLARLGEEKEVVKSADELYKHLTELGVSVLYDDRDERAGTKFADADLMGIPYRVVVSQKTVDSGNIEIKSRIEKDSQLLSEKDLIKKLVA
ncbi:MAG: aminoacyl--tRNA ligase-related protein [Candidatus Saccharibacteria bacterium]